MKLNNRKSVFFVVLHRTVSVYVYPMCLMPAIPRVQLTSVMAMKILSVLQTTILSTSMLYTEGVTIDVAKSDI